MEGRGAGPGRAVCECQKWPRRAPRWCALVGDSVALGEVGAGLGAGSISPRPGGLCSVGREHRVQTPAGRSEALSSKTSPTSVLTKGFLPYSLILGLLHFERM